MSQISKRLLDVIFVIILSPLMILGNLIIVMLASPKALTKRSRIVCLELSICEVTLSHDVLANRRKLGVSTF